MDAAVAATDRQVTTIALVGNPNTGKTTLFNALTGLSQHVGNYPGVTVEKKTGRMRAGGRKIELIDLPGTYSLAAHSPDEMVVADVLLGKQEGCPSIGGVLAIVDACNLERHLYLVSQVIEFGLPVVIALNMIDVAAGRGIRVDARRLAERLQIPVVPICASKGKGIDQLRQTVVAVLEERDRVAPPRPEFPPELDEAIGRLVEYSGSAVEGIGREISRVELARVIVDEGGYAERDLVEALGPIFARRLEEVRGGIGSAGGLATLETEARHAWVREMLDGCVEQEGDDGPTRSDRIDELLTHRIAGTLIFLAIMGVVFQAIFTWAGPLMDGIDGLFGDLGKWVGEVLPEGPLQSLIVDGIIGGVGGVVVFVPQIAILFFFISILEDCGYMSRAAMLMDRLLTKCGLSGKSFIPMLSSFACAVPGIMAARTIDDRRDRFTTILIAPLMSCSARLPVYTIFIATFIPDRTVLGGWIGLQGLTLFGLYGLGVAVAVPVAWLLKKTLLRGEAPPFLLELPSYKQPDAKTVGLRVFQSTRAFLVRAGTVILAVTIAMWALAYFPRSEEVIERFDGERQEAESRYQGAALEEAVAALDAAEAAALLEQSFLGRAGKFIEPAVRPLGWDWRIGMATLASFPAREVIVSTLGTIFSLGGDEDESSEGLRSALESARRSDGSRIFTIPVALSIMVFFALCAQCAATLATIQRETGSWGWAVFSFGYMTTLAYAAAFAVYHGATALGWG